MTGLSPTPANLVFPSELAGFDALDHLVREQVPHWLDQAGLTETAETLRQLPPITDVDTARKAPLIDAQNEAYRVSGVVSWAEVSPAAFKSVDDVKAAEQASWSAVPGGHLNPDHRIVTAVAGWAHTACVFAAQALLSEHTQESR